MDTQYILGCSLELAETTALENAVLSSPLGAYDAVRRLVDNDLAMPRHFLQNTAAAFLESADEAQRYFFALSSLPAQAIGLKAFKERAEHVVQHKAQIDLGVIDAPMAIEGLERPGDALMQAGRLVQRDCDIDEGLVRQMLETACGDLARRWSRDLSLLADAADWYGADAGQTFNGMLLSPKLGLERKESSQTVMQLATRAQQARARRLAAESVKRLSAARTAIKKATKLFQSLGQQDNLQLMVSGKEVTLAHPESSFKFVLRPPKVSGWLIDRSLHGRSHTPYDIELLTKDDVYLARLCVYFDNTPALDQLLALTLFVQSGDEERILEKANWFGLDDWSEEKARRVTSVYPELASKLPGKREREEGPTPLHFIGRAHRAQAEHWEPFKGRVEQWVATWMEPARLALQRVAPALAPVPGQLIAAQELEQQRNLTALAATRHEAEMLTP